jgi:integrase/recombinase XerD
MIKQFQSLKPALHPNQPGLEYWYRQKRTLVDFRRGPLGTYFDGFASHLQAKGYCQHWGGQILSKCCHFNSFLIDQGVTKCKELSESLVNSFLDLYLQDIRTNGEYYSPRVVVRGCLKHLFAYLIDIKALAPPKPKPIKKPYNWILNPYLRYLRDECELHPVTIRRAQRQIESFLEALQQRARRDRFRALNAEIIENYINQQLKTSRENRGSMTGSLRSFFRYCASRRFTCADFSGLLPSVRYYRHASLPKGMEDSVLKRVLNAIPRDGAIGARDYAISILMMAYGIRGISAAELLLDDIDWQHSRIRIRAKKGGKEVMLPLMPAVGEAIIEYLRHRRSETPFREVFLTNKAPFRPLSSLAVSNIVRRHMKRAGVKTPGTGSSTLRHSWAIRALAHDSPIKTIADTLGHRYIDTTFIYAKADLKTLREVALPWPKRG